MPKRADKPEEVAQEVAEKAPARKAPAKAAGKAEKKVVEKFPMLEKAKKFLEKVRKGLGDEVFDAKEVEAGKQGEQKMKIVFLNFCLDEKTKDHDELTPEEDAYNVECIKEVLFYYHTGVDSSTDSAVVLQVVPPLDGDGFHLLAYQEIQDK